MSKSATDTVPAAVESPAATLSTLARNGLRSMSAAMAEKGAARSRAVTRVKDSCAQAIAFALSAPSGAVAQAMVSVPTVRVTRGEETRESTQVKAIDLLRSLAYGGTLVGSAKIDWKSGQ